MWSLKQGLLLLKVSCRFPFGRALAHVDRVSRCQTAPPPSSVRAYRTRGATILHNRTKLESPCRVADPACLIQTLSARASHLHHTEPSREPATKAARMVTNAPPVAIAAAATPCPAGARRAAYAGGSRLAPGAAVVRIGLAAVAAARRQPARPRVEASRTVLAGARRDAPTRGAARIIGSVPCPDLGR